MQDAAKVASRDFPQWLGSPWKLRGMGSSELDSLLDEAKTAREPVDTAACDRLDREMRIYSNPRRVRSNSTTLRNLASVKITRNRDGTVGIVARRNAPKKRNR